jgi:hypothetical protein
LSRADMPAFRAIRNSIWRQPQPQSQWTYIDDSPLTLVQELQDLYWLGIERDLNDIIRALQIWDKEEYNNAIPPAPSLEAEDWVGFDDFLRRATGERSIGM